MKIGLVLPNTPGYSETFFRNKVLGLQDEGHEVLLYVGNSKSIDNYLNCKVISAPQLNGNPLVVIWNTIVQLLKMLFINLGKSAKLYRLNKEDGISFRQNLKQILSNQFLLSERLDWLHFGFGTMALGRENAAAAIGARMAVSFRGFDIGIYPIKNPNCYDLLFKKVDRVHVISDDLKQLLYKYGLGNDKQVIKITPAINTSFFESIGQSQNTVLQFTTIARLHWKKGLEYTLEALALLRKDAINFHYTIVGDGSERERLQFAIHQLGLNDHVTLAGKLSSEQVKDVLSTTDVYLQYSIQEGFCNAVLEAQAMGIICVVSDAEGLSENVINNSTGFVVAKQNPTFLFEKIKEVIHLSEIKKQAISDQAVLRVKKEFNLEKQQKEFLAFYTE